MKIADLIFKDQELIINGIGLYIFYKVNQEKPFLYVGKCSSRHFIERISSHFDPRLNGWFNSFLKTLMKNENLKSDIEKQRFINKKISEIFSSNSGYKIGLIEVPSDFKAKSIEKIESILRFILEPINKKKKGPDKNITLADVLNEM
ncbi:MAG: hypothetical protein GYA71_04835 [Bacteroidales bacterium]|nr:hypothetical protein [Bacteroidales bacterium]